MISPKNVMVKIESFTGALLTEFRSDTEHNSSLEVELMVKKFGGLDEFVFTLANNYTDPLYTDMHCKFYVNGAHWFTGYATSVPGTDSYAAGVKVEGLGFMHKLKKVQINESYTATSLSDIVDDIATANFGQDLGVFYNPALIDFGTDPDLSISFDDKSIYECFVSLTSAANFDYQNNQYAMWVDKDRYLNVGRLPSDPIYSWFEGYHYQYPEIEEVKDKLVNVLPTYVPTTPGAKDLAYLGTFSDTQSIAVNGEILKKLTLSSYVDAPTASLIADGILQRYKDPLVKQKISEVPVSSPFDFGIYKMSNRRTSISRAGADTTSLDDWDIVNLNSTVASISDEQVLTDRNSLKLVSSPGSAGDYMEYTLPEIINYPGGYTVGSFRVELGAMYTISLYDTFGNIVNILIGHSGETVNEWLRYDVDIKLGIIEGFMEVTKDVGESGLMIVDKTPTESGRLVIDYLVNDGLLNLTKVRITVDSDIACTGYFDDLNVTSNSFVPRELYLEEAEYKLGNYQLCAMTFGEKGDSLVDEVLKDSALGKVALSIFAKQ